jgi:UDP-N-acetylglucosamine/UDP-N-acetyl-alpha-D-glucosaminouronate 4-epimerase
MYLVTGGAGFIGSHIVERLTAMGKRVRVLDNLSAGNLENITGLTHRVDLVSGNLTNLSAVRRAMAGVNVVFHQAALRSAALSVENPSLVNQVNVEGTLNVLLAARDAGVHRVVYASSCLVYGNTETVPQNEDLPLSPSSPYAVSKVAGEHYCKVFSELYGLETVTLRYFDVFGPGQDASVAHPPVIARFIDAALRGEPLEIHGDGQQTRDFTYIDNIVDANLLAAESAEAAGEIFNIGQNRSVSLLDLIDLLRRTVRPELNWSHAKPRSGDVKHSRADISKAARILGYRPRVSFEEGFEKTVEYFRKRRDWKSGENRRAMGAS